MSLAKLFDLATYGELKVVDTISNEVDTLIFPLFVKGKGKQAWRDELGALPEKVRQLALRHGDRIKFKLKGSGAFAITPEKGPRAVLAFWKKGSAFETLGWGRQVIALASHEKAKKLALVLDSKSIPALCLDAIVSSFFVKFYVGPRYGKRKPPTNHVYLEIESKKLSPEWKKVVERAEAESRAANGQRHLIEMAGNDLTPTKLKELAMSATGMGGISAEFIDRKALEKRGAGAFLAVVRGTTEPNVGIVRLKYSPKGASKRVVLVGKGVTFDTGGNNLKPSEYMLGMNGDMGGSALVLSLFYLATRLKWPFALEGFVTVAENVIGPSAYRPNDVVVAINGKSIEVIDTDAEGRMLLADALCLAAETKPELIMDFATLTGACVRAIGTAYSGVFSNKTRLLPRLVRAGKISGERVWAFPNDSDYGHALKSKIADIKQCRPSGGSDHIEASYFLRQFAGKSPYVHVDLSAVENEGGLAHVPTKVTGFGLRFSHQFLLGELG